MSDAPALSPPPELEQVAGQFDRAQAKARRITRWMLVVAAILTLVAFLLPDGLLSRAMQRGIFISLGAWAVLAVLPILILRLRSKPLRSLPPGPIGSITSAELGAIVADAEREFIGREQPTVYILDDDIPNAMAVDSLALDFVSACNAIYLSRGLLATLSREEIRAVYLHELAHFQRYIYHDNRTKLPIYLCLSFALAPIALLPDVAWIEWGAVVVTLLAFGVLFGSALSERTERDIEFLCDQFAASRAGHLHMVNALLRIGHGMKEPLAKRKLLKASVKKLAGRPALDWKSIDSHIPDHRIDAHEYPRLIEALRARCDATVLQSPIDIESITHPSLGRRILFLDQHAGV